MAESKIHAVTKLDEPDCYTTEPTHLRVWRDTGEWFVDGMDDEGRYTESCWTYDSFTEVLADLHNFPEHATPRLTWRWRGQR